MGVVNSYMAGMKKRFLTYVKCRKYIYVTFAMNVFHTF